MIPFDGKKSCVWTRERIETHLDGELAPGDKVEFDSHIESCLSCREELDLARRVLSELRGLPNLACPEHVTNEVFTAIGPADMQASSGWIQRWLAHWGARPARPALIGGTLVLAVVAAALIGRVRNGADEVSPQEIARAKTEVKWTLAYVDRVSRRTGFMVRDEVLGERVVEPMRRAVHTALPSDHSTTQPNNGGS